MLSGDVFFRLSASCCERHSYYVVWLPIQVKYKRYYVKKCANLTLNHAMLTYGGMEGMVGFMFWSLATVPI